MPSVIDLMTNDVITIDSSKTVLDAAAIMTEKKVGCIIVMDETGPVGIVTERDIVRRFVYQRLLSRATNIGEIMSTPLITIDANSSLRDAARLMLKNGIRRLPVVHDKKVVGILTVSDFARHLSKKTITEEILAAMARHPSSYSLQQG